MERTPTTPPRVWTRRALVFGGLLLIVAAMGLVGGALTYHIVYTSVDECAEVTKDTLIHIQRNPDDTESRLLELRETFDSCREPYGAASYFLADAPPSGQELHWIGFIVYLHDHGDQRATERLKKIHIGTSENTVSLLKWLQARAEEELEPVYLEQMENLHLEESSGTTTLLTFANKEM